MIRGTGIDSTVKLYLKCNGANGSTKFYDDSQSHHTVTANGNVKISTDYSKFGGSSMYFDGNGDYISLPDDGAFNFLHQVGTDGKWTIGFFLRINTGAAGTRPIIDTTRNTYANSGILISLTAGDSIIVYIARGDSSSPVVIFTSSVWGYNENQWYYMQISYDQSLSSNNLKIYIDGALFGQATKTGNTSSVLDCEQPYIGIFDPNLPGSAFDGYIDDYTIRDGVVVDGTKVPTRQRG